MYQVCVRRHFDAAHALRNYHGKCERLHGHRWEVVACIRSEELDESGMAYDFADLKGWMDEILDRYDHHHLNQVAPFDRVNPTTENIARVIYERLSERLVDAWADMVRVYESPDAWVTYRPGVDHGGDRVAVAVSRQSAEERS